MRMSRISRVKRGEVLPRLFAEVLKFSAQGLDALVERSLRSLLRYYGDVLPCPHKDKGEHPGVLR